MVARLLDGSNTPPPEPQILHAGPLTLDYEPGQIRAVRIGNREIVRAVYAAVRDQNWGTVPGTLSEVSVRTDGHSFELSFTSDHRQQGIHYVWHGAIHGQEDGTIQFSFDGEAKTGFRRNRIGFCVLHPMEVAGMPCIIEHTDGTVEHTKFPEVISPHQPFVDVRAIRHEVTPGLSADVRMDGDAFETEDQRNWTDASFKTYCTPLGLPFPVEVRPGDQVHQVITIRLIGSAAAPTAEDAASSLQVTDLVRPIPPIGLCYAADSQLSVRELAQLATLRPNHLRVDIDPVIALKALREATDVAGRCGAQLEIAVHLGDSVDADLQRIAGAVDIVHPPIARWLIFRFGERSTRRATVQAARAALTRFGAPIGAGTDAFFAELNRERPPADELDWVCFSNNPQVHAFDNRSLVETLAANAATVHSVRTFSGDARIAVTPVTLKMRWNPNATAAEPVTPPEVLPRRVDPRQMSLFGAAWTLGCLRALILAGADSLTFFETVGWLGVIERDSGSPLPELFPSMDGGVFPLYHPLADALEFADGEAKAIASNAPLTAEGIWLQLNGRSCVLAANYTASVQPLTIQGVSGSWRVRYLDESCVEWALRDPTSFRATSGALQSAGPDGLRLTLLPYATVRCDLS